MGMTRGAFGYVQRVTPKGAYLFSSWETCREVFHQHSGKLRLFLFCHKPGAGPDIAAFIDRVERMVAVSPRTVIGATQYSRVSYVRLSNWWLKDDMRRSLFTALLRDAQYYDSRVGNFEQTLCALRYTRQTLPAVKRFLRGYTRYTGDVVGWHRQFFQNGKSRGKSPPTEGELRKLLVKP